jgi:hypothetical protein
MVRVLRHQHRRSQEDRRNQKNQKMFYGFVSSWLSLYPRTLLPLEITRAEGRAAGINMDANFSAQGWTNCRARVMRKNPVAGPVKITEGLRRKSGADHASASFRF